MDIDTDPDDLPVRRHHHEHERHEPPRRIVDMRIPLAWLIGAAVTFSGFIFGLYFQVGQLSKDVADLKTTVNTGNAQSSLALGELAILKYRVDEMEKKVRQ